MPQDDAASDPATSPFLDLLDWRRRVSDLYAEVRQERQTVPQAAHARWVAGREALFRQHPQSPVPSQERPGFGGPQVWPYDPAYALTAELQTDLAPQRFTVITSAGHEMPLVRAGRLHCELGALDVYWIDVYGGGLFLPFRDATSGAPGPAGSYGGGRYLLDTVKGADLGSDARGRLHLDFNFAYHPSCFYAPRWSCPLAPPTNRLAAAVRAGERGGGR
ncbi:MAG: DUF1684 domain-containing protein [Deinococcus sp.]